MRYPEFAKAVAELAPTRREIARLLGVGQRMTYYYLAGTKAPRPEIAKRYPQIDAALSRDVAAMFAAPSTPMVSECKE